MDLNNVLLEIINDAQRKAKQINEEAKKERELLLDKTMEKIEKRKIEIEKENKEKIEKTRIKEIAVSRMNAKKIEMVVKKQALEKVYEKFSEKIGTINVLKKLFDSGSNEIEASTIYVSKKDFEKAKTLFKNISVKPAEIKGGLIIENKESTEKIDLSLETIIEDTKKETLSEVSKILFGGK